METFKEKIGEYIEKNKKNSKLNKKEIDEVVLLLKDAINSQNALVDDIIDVIFELHYSVTANFVKNVFIDLNEQFKDEFINKFLSTDKIIKNASNYGTNRCLVIVNELLKINGSSKFIHILLKSCTKKAYGKDRGQKAGELLYKICLNDTKDKLLLLDYSEWQENDLRNLSNWIDNAITYTNDEEIIASYYAFIQRYNLMNNSSVVKINDAKINQNQQPQIDNSDTSKKPREKIFVLVDDLKLEINNAVNERNKLYKEVEEVRSKVEQLNREKENLSLQLSETRNRNEELQEQIRIKQAQINNAEKKISEMNERLEYAYKAEKRAENQEIASLKNELVKQLKPDYYNFLLLASKEQEEYKVYYQGLIGIVENIFDALRRKGIIINKKNED